MKALILAAVASAMLAASAGTALAQYGDAVAIQRNYRGEQICPSNYVIRGNACVNVDTLRSQGRSTAERPGREYYRDDYDDPRPRRRYRGEYDQGREYYGGGPPRGPQAVQPHINHRGQVACPSNYIIQGNLCVSVY